MTEALQRRRQPPVRRCAFCGYEIPGSVDVVGDPERPCCSEPCRDALAADDEPFRDAVGFKRRPVGVAALDAGLPHGVPGNAAVLLAGQEGTRRAGLLLEWVWRALQRGEPAVVCAVDRPPVALVDSFLAHGWNVLPHLHRRDLVVADLFTRRLEDRETFTRRNDRWNGFVEDAFDRGIEELRDPTDVREVVNQVDSLLEDLGVEDEGVVAVESLTSIATFTQAVQAATLLQELRAVVAKSRYVPLVSAASVPRDDDLYPTNFPHDHEYVFDGIVDLELDGEQQGRVQRLSVRKMDDATRRAGWVPYAFRPDAGYVPVEVPGTGQ